jgi:hypothetical protein
LDDGIDDTFVSVVDRPNDRRFDEILARDFNGGIEMFVRSRVRAGVGRYPRSLLAFSHLFASHR